ncbi:MAG: malto-oligosyltrehalose trehalohydrolase [Cyanobacteria bacterium J06648_16]
MSIGAMPKGNGHCQFTLWAPMVDTVELKLVSPQPATVPMTQLESGYWQATVENVGEGARYFYIVNGNERPDPVAYYQPEGVHGPSEVVDHSQYAWQDADWRNPDLADYIIYELHVGTFTPASTFSAIIDRLPDLKSLGITAIEIMPVAQFPGERNWGYDGVCPFAVQNSYGGPTGLKTLVDACHREGLAVIMDVVYNHFGPEGNYTSIFGPYVTPKYRTPWGSAINFDDAQSGGVRDYFIQNALVWLRDYHIDALRLDAIHAIYDFGARHFLLDLAERVEDLSQSLGKAHYLIAESDLNDVRIIRDRTQGGFGLDAQWSDDFHHALHTLLTGENNGYYSDFGTCEALAIALHERFVYSWKYSKFRQRYHGSVASDLPASKFVICAQNHDQVGNRMLGERLTHLVSFEGLKLSAGILLTAPYIPMLFMGEEYGEDAPFLYFIDHGDADLIEAVRTGRTEEFKDFYASGSPPDAAAVQTFKDSTLNWVKRQQGHHQQLWHYYQRLIQLRKQLQLSAPSVSDDLTVFSEEKHKIVYYQRPIPDGHVLCLMNFSQKAAQITVPKSHDPWQKLIDSAATEWGGPGAVLSEQIRALDTIKLAPQSFALYRST